MLTTLLKRNVYHSFGYKCYLFISSLSMSYETVQADTSRYKGPTSLTEALGNGDVRSSSDCAVARSIRFICLRRFVGLLKTGIQKKSRTKITAVNSWETESFSVQRPWADGRGQFAVTPELCLEQSTCSTVSRHMLFC